MYSGESQQFLCLAGYRPPCLHLRAFHSTTGKQFWHEEIPIQLSGPVGALVVSDGVLYLTGWNGSVVAIDAKTRRIRWHYQRQWGHLIKLDVLGGIISPHTYKNTLPALHAPTGELLWSYEHEPIQDHPRYQIITLLENRDHLLTCQRVCESEHDSYDSSFCKDIFRTCLFNKERGKKCRATT